ncbi:MAG: hypothetical protein ACREB3_02160, partial [Burkholderiales bacterium]
MQTSTGAVSVAPLLLVDLKTDGGIVGRSYLFAITRSALKPIAALVEAMGEMLQGDAVAPFEIEKKLRARYTLLGVHNMVLFALSGIDMAAWDALGRVKGVSLCSLLGGFHRKKISLTKDENPCIAPDWTALRKDILGNRYELLRIDPFAWGSVEMVQAIAAVAAAFDLGIALLAPNAHRWVIQYCA